MYPRSTSPHSCSERWLPSLCCWPFPLLCFLLCVSSHSAKTHISLESHGNLGKDSGIWEWWTYTIPYIFVWRAAKYSMAWARGSSVPSPSLIAQPLVPVATNAIMCYSRAKAFHSSRDALGPLQPMWVSTLGETPKVQSCQSHSWGERKQWGACRSHKLFLLGASQSLRPAQA